MNKNEKNGSYIRFEELKALMEQVAKLDMQSAVDVNHALNIKSLLVTLKLTKQAAQRLLKLRMESALLDSQAEIDIVTHAIAKVEQRLEKVS